MVEFGLVWLGLEWLGLVWLGLIWLSLSLLNKFEHFYITIQYLLGFYRNHQPQQWERRNYSSVRSCPLYPSAAADEEKSEELV